MRTLREREKTRGSIVCLCMSLISPARACVCVFTIAHSVSSVIYIARDEKNKYSNKNEKKASSWGGFLSWIISLRKRLDGRGAETRSVSCYFLVDTTFALGTARVGDRWLRTALIGPGTLRRFGEWSLSGSRDNSSRFVCA